jgi:AP-3 complex subunit delta-1
LKYPKTALEALLTSYVQKFPTYIQTVYIQSVPKVFSTWATEVTSAWTPDSEFEFVINQIIRWIDPFRYSENLEVQERSVGFYQLFQNFRLKIQDTQVLESQHDCHNETTESWAITRTPAPFLSLDDLTRLFSDIELNPVGAKAQRKVPLPDGLDLQTSLFPKQEYIPWPSHNLDEEEIPRVSTPVATERRRHDRIHDDPFYILGDNRRPHSRADTPISGEDDFDSIPIIQFDGGTNLLAPIAKVRRKKKTREIVLDDTPVDIAVDEMPENAALSDTEVNSRKENRKGKSVLSNKQMKGLEDIDFGEEERMEREAIEAEHIARQIRAANVSAKTRDVDEGPLVVERLKKKKKKVVPGDVSKKAKKKQTVEAM